MNSLSAQTSIGTCGIAPPHTATSTNPDEIYFDRFGNSYDIEEFTESSNFSSSNAVPAGYFDLDFVGTIPEDVKDVCIFVFENLSNTIIRRTNTFDCDEPVPFNQIEITISYELFPIDEDEVLDLAYASAYSYNHISLQDCSSTTRNRIYDQLNGSYSDNTSAPAGFIAINSDITTLWHTDLENGPTPGFNQHDLYSVITHEALHLLGYSSNILPDGNPNDTGILGNTYTIWDQKLFSADGNSTPLSSVLINSSTSCTSDCWDLNLDCFGSEADWENLASNNCTTNQTEKLFYGEAGLAPVFGGNGELPDPTDPDYNKEFRNGLSHLHPDCGNISEDYLMQPELPRGIRREITSVELDILCDLGYQTTSCDGCFLTTHPETRQHVDISDIFSCCSNYYGVCQGEEISIPFDELLCNDFSNGDAVVSDVWSLNSNISIVPNVNGLGVTITALNIEPTIALPGTYEIFYTVSSSSCDCVTSNSSFLFYVNQCFDCSNVDECDNLSCLVDLLPAIDNNPIYLNNVLIGYEGTVHNYIAVSESPGGDVSFALVNDYETFEGNAQSLLVVPLSEPVEPGCELLIEFDAYPITNFLSLSVQGSESPPCTISESLIPVGCDDVIVDCGSSIYQPYCIEEAMPINSFGAHSTTWINNTNQNINNIIISPATQGLLQLENIVITKNCLPVPDFEYTIECLGVTFEVINDTGEYSYSWDFGDNTTGTEAFAMHSYLEGGEYEITLTITDECENTKSTTQLIELLPNDPSFTSSYDCTGNDISVTVSFFSGANALNSMHFWDFGDVSTSNEINPSNTYISGGPWTVTHTVTDDCENVEIFEEVIDLTDCIVIPPDCCPAGFTFIPTDMTFSEAINQGLLLPVSEANSTPQSLCINGQLTLDTETSEYHFFETVFIMNDGAEIVVNGFDSHLAIVGSTMSGCDEMWKGITVNAKAKLDVESSTIEDAEFAVNVKHKGTALLEGNTFSKNHIAVEVNIGLLEHPVGFANLTVINNNFNCTNETLLPPFSNISNPTVGTKSFAGIRLENAGTINIGADTGTGGNQFVDMVNGIYSTRTNLSSIKNTFTNMANSSVSPLTIGGYGVFSRGYGHSLIVKGEANGLEFNNCETGIGVKQGMNVDISGNQMDFVNTGISVKNCQNRKIIIDHNDISCDKVGISLLQNDNASKMNVAWNVIDVGLFSGADSGGSGIYVGNEGSTSFEDADIELNQINCFKSHNKAIEVISSNKLIVRGNIIELNGSKTKGISFEHAYECEATCNEVTGSGAILSYAIDICNSDNAVYTCNILDETGTGMRFAGNSLGVTLKGTEFGDHSTGLHLSHLANFGPNNSQNNYGNRWTGSYSYAAALNEVQAENISETKFIVNELISPIYPPSISTPNAPNADWFEYQDGGNTYTCGPSSCELPGLVGQEITDLDKLIAQYLMEWDLYDEERRWLAERYLYKKLSNDLSLLGENADVDDFFNTKETENIGKFQEIEASKKEVNNLLVSDREELEQYRVGTTDYLNQLALLDKQILETSSPSEKEALLSSKEIILDLLETLSIDAKVLNEVIAATKDADAEWVKTENGLILTTELYHSNEKTVNNIYLNTAAKGNDEFTSTQISNLTFIALQCPVTGGNAVFKARSLLAMNGEIVDYDNFALCDAVGILLNVRPEESGEAEMQAEKQSASEKQISKFSVYPNPTSEHLVIECMNDCVEENKIEIVDFLGKRVLYNVLNSDSHTLNIDTKDWQPGVYFLNITNQKETVFSEKVIVLR